MWHRGVVVITTAQLHSVKPELRTVWASGSSEPKPQNGKTKIS